MSDTSERAPIRRDRRKRFHYELRVGFQAPADESADVTVKVLRALVGVDVLALEMTRPNDSVGYSGSDD